VRGCVRDWSGYPATTVVVRSRSGKPDPKGNALILTVVVMRSRTRAYMIWR
jgi:hypothetical protein